MAARKATFSIREVYSSAWALTKRYWLLVLGWNGLYLLYFLGVNMLTTPLGMESPELALIMQVVNGLVGMWISTAAVRVGLRLVRGEMVVFKDIFWFDRGVVVKYFLTSILVTLVVVLGFLLLIIPGIIFSLLFSMAYVVVVDEGLNGWAAMMRSKELMSGNILKYIGFGILSVLLIIGGALLLVLPLLVVIPLVSIAQVLVYVRLKESLQAGAQDSASPIATVPATAHS